MPMNTLNTESMNYIQIENLTKSYLEGSHERPVLVEANASFGHGESIAIVGHSGSGKSTLLNLISGIDLVDGGRICVNGVDLIALNERRRTLYRRQYIGFIFQFFNLIPTLTSMENVTLPLELNGVPLRDARRRAGELLDSVGLGDRAATFPDRLSGGEQQRVAIARAVIHNPLLLLADEPTGNLDEETGAEILSLLDGLTRGSGRNLIMVTHNRETAELADRIFYLREGKLTEECEGDEQPDG